jgi:hypothetical protein
MPRTVIQQFDVYRFDELTPQAKDRAREWHQRAGDAYVWAHEALDSLKAFAQHFGARLTNWQIDWANSSPSRAEFTTPYDDPTPEELAEQLDALGTYNPETLRGLGECKLTGYCTDENAIDGFRIAFMRDGERDLSKLLQAGFRTWLAACHADYADFYSDETFAEHCHNNDYEFKVNGEFYS